MIIGSWEFSVFANSHDKKTSIMLV